MHVQMYASSYVCTNSKKAAVAVAAEAVSRFRLPQKKQYTHIHTNLTMCTECSLMYLEKNFSNMQHSLIDFIISIELPFPFHTCVHKESYTERDR